MFISRILLIVAHFDSVLERLQHFQQKFGAEFISDYTSYVSSFFTLLIGAMISTGYCVDKADQ